MNFSDTKVTETQNEPSLVLLPCGESYNLSPPKHSVAFFPLWDFLASYTTHEVPFIHFCLVPGICSSDFFLRSFSFLLILVCLHFYGICNYLIPWLLLVQHKKHGLVLGVTFARTIFANLYEPILTQSAHTVLQHAYIQKNPKINPHAPCIIVIYMFVYILADLGALRASPPQNPGSVVSKKPKLRTNPNFEQTQSSNKSKLRSNPNFEQIQISNKPKSFWPQGDLE